MEQEDQGRDEERPDTTDYDSGAGWERVGDAMDRYGAAAVLANPDLVEGPPATPGHERDDERIWRPGDDEPGPEVLEVRTRHGRRYKRNPLGGWSRVGYDATVPYSHRGHSWEDLLDFRRELISGRAD